MVGLPTAFPFPSSGFAPALATGLPAATTLACGATIFLARTFLSSFFAALIFFAAGFARSAAFFFKCLILLTFFLALGARLNFGLRVGLAMLPLDGPG